MGKREGGKVEGREDQRPVFLNFCGSRSLSLGFFNFLEQEEALNLTMCVREGRGISHWKVIERGRDRFTFPLSTPKTLMMIDSKKDDFFLLPFCISMACFSFFLSFQFVGAL